MRSKLYVWFAALYLRVKSRIAEKLCIFILGLLDGKQAAMKIDHYDLKCHLRIMSYKNIDDPWSLYQEGNMSKSKLLEIIVNEVELYLREETTKD